MLTSAIDLDGLLAEADGVSVSDVSAPPAAPAVVRQQEGVYWVKVK